MARLSKGLFAGPVAMSLAAACALLALLIGYLLASAVDTSPIQPGAQVGAGQQAAGNLATPLDAKPISELRETVRRPLFNSNRKPMDRPKSARRQEVTQAGSALDMHLVGVVRSSRPPDRALIRLADESDGKWIAEGETFNGWKLRSVKDRSVIVEADGRSHELKLQVVVHQAEEPGDTPEPATKSR